MPSQTIHSALVQIYYDYDGAPWNFSAWKELTGIYHGLFPKDDKLLPKGWSRQTANEIHSYFEQFRSILTEDEKLKFASSKGTTQNVPGRKAWRDWVTKIWRVGRMHEKIIRVLSAENLHPYTLMSQHDSLNIWPPANQWVPLAIDPIGLALFGEECYSEGLDRVRLPLRQSTGSLITRSWIVLRASFDRSKKNIDDLESKAIGAFEDLDRGKLTKAKIKTVVEKVLKWKQIVEALNTPEGEEQILEMMSELERLMVGLDQKVKTTSKKSAPTASKKKIPKSLCKVSAQMLQSLASQEDITDIINLFDECFNLSTGDSSQLEGQVATVPFNLVTCSDGADPGTEVEATMSPTLLSQHLGFTNHIPILFNTHKHNGGVTPWDDSAAFQNEDLLKSDKAFTPIELRWHQLAGVHAVLRRMLTPEPSHVSPGILIADEVGLGKTLQALAIIAWLTECAGRMSRKSNLPPILTANPYLGGSKSIPNNCHLIVVPGTILSQWASEIRIFLNPKAFDYFIYTSGQGFRDNFWSESGPFTRSNQPGANKIILATHSALSQDYQLLFLHPKASSKALPWRKPKPVASYDSIVQKTLFGLDFLSVTIDEAHEFRNAGGKQHSAALAILEKAKTRLIMTATPLQTSTKDLASMGRMVGIDFFFSQQALDEEKADMTEVRRAKAALGEDYDPLDVEKDDDDPIRETQAAIALRIHGQFEQRVLRRTRESKNWIGEKLVNLPKLHEHTVLLTLQSFEQEIHSEIAEKMRDELSFCSTTKAFSSSFYLPSRMGATYPRLSLTDKIPRFKTLEEWQSQKSTKVDVAAHMCLHVLSRDDAPSMVFKDGTVIFPELPNLMPGEQVSQTTKVLIYQEFPSFGPLVRNVFNLYNIRHLYIDGQTTYDARAKLVKTFNEDQTIRVLFFTSVGANGLNLTMASVVILIDQPWSAQDETQILGRAYRQGQMKEVRCYHLLADETSDVVLSALARGKRNMLETFLQQPKGQEILELMTQGIIPSDGDLNDDEGRVVANGTNKVAKQPIPEDSEMQRSQPKLAGATQSATSISEIPSGNPFQEDKARTRKAPKPKPKPRKKNTDVSEPAEKRKGKQTGPEGGKEKPQTQISSTGELAVPISDTQERHSSISETDGPVLPSTGTKLRATTKELNVLPLIAADSPSPSSLSFPSRIEVRPAPKTPPREAVGKRRGRSQYRSEPDSPEALKSKKRSRVELVSYISSPEKPAAGGRSSPDSVMLDHHTEDTQDSHLVDIIMNRNDDTTLTQSFSSAKISDDFYVDNECEQWAQPTNGWRGGMQTMDRSPAVTERQPPNSPPPLPLPNRSNSPITSDTEDQRRDQEKREMRLALREKIHATTKPLNEEAKIRQDRLRTLKLKLVKDQEMRLDVAGSSSTSMTRKYDIPDIRRATILQQSDRLSPPPRSTPSQNPYSRNNGLRKTTKSRWEQNP